MAGTRLTFLYPHLFRSTGRWTEPALSQASQAARPKPQSSPPPPPPPSLGHHQRRPFTAPSTNRQAAFAKRAGKGVEPLPSQETPEIQDAAAAAAAATTKPEPQPEKGPKPPPTQIKKKYKKSQEQQTLKTTQETSDSDSGSDSVPPFSKPIELPPPSDIDPQTQAKKGSPMNEILHMQPPAAEAPTATLTPNPSPSHGPPSATPHHNYVHHFDSYSLVKHLSSGGYTLPQAIQTMKAIRGILASNLDDAQAKLVSKSDVENETYLFRAACSELSAEVRNNRRVSDEAQRQQRTLLQHEVDILTQRLNQELMTLTDSVRGMFTDRRMAVREEQKAVESRIQEINYKISVRLNSDAKSDIEGLRWVLIRRSVFGIVFMAVLTFGSLRYATFKSHQRQQEAARIAEEKEEARRSGGKLDLSSAPEAAEILAAN
ncbi:hypothetical protein QBC44DRAFT_73598 [Cladorrhinum sp. PSN332]|nr:hypothetical protein QBC44DRAFT_73598 [Cladorrhinum sp. PSN332]